MKSTIVNGKQLNNVLLAVFGMTRAWFNHRNDTAVVSFISNNEARDLVERLNEGPDLGDPLGSTGEVLQAAVKFMATADEPPSSIAGETHALREILADIFGDLKNVRTSRIKILPDASLN